MPPTELFPILATCDSCGAQNRIPAAHLADQGRCGACKATLRALRRPLEVDESAFAEVIRSAKVPVLVDFWASWCGPCRMAAPEVEKLARLAEGEALVLKVNTETHPNLAARYGIRSIPAFLVFRDGQVVMQRAGVASHAEMRKWLEYTGAKA
jgi:thioredoxin 2